MNLENLMKASNSLAQGMFQRKNYIDAVPHFRRAYGYARQTGFARMELSCLNNLIACMRMTGLSGCSDVDALNDRALEIVSRLDFQPGDLISCVNAYVNAGATQILRRNWMAAISILDVADALITSMKSHRLQNEPTPASRNEAALLQSIAQAHMGLFAESRRGGDEEDANIRCTILSCFQRILELPVPDNTKAHAHQGLAYYFERISRTPDLLSMVRHRRAAWAGVGMLPQAQCPICAEEIADEHPDLTALGCFHMFHRCVGCCPPPTASRPSPT